MKLLNLLTLFHKIKSPESYVVEKKRDDIQYHRITDNSYIIKYNEMQIRKLKEEKPDISEIDIIHKICFADKNHRNKFLSSIWEQGFKLLEKNKTHHIFHRYSVTIARKENISTNALNFACIQLLVSAKQYHGIYYGWLAE